MAEVVADGVTGTLVSSATSESLADAVRALVSDDLRRESLGLAAGDRARASFDWAPVATAVARVAREVAADGEGRPADVLHSG
jgi:glycosyltransferase involved in cell wall biosynthesis